MWTTQLFCSVELFVQRSKIFSHLILIQEDLEARLYSPRELRQEVVIDRELLKAHLEELIEGFSEAYTDVAVLGLLQNLFDSAPVAFVFLLEFLVFKIDLTRNNHLLVLTLNDEFIFPPRANNQVQGHVFHVI